MSKTFGILGTDWNSARFKISAIIKDCNINNEFGWLVVLGLLDSISVYIGPSPREREREKRNDR